MINLIHILFFSFYTYRLTKKDGSDTAMGYSVGFLSLTLVFIIMGLLQIAAYVLKRADWIDKYIFSTGHDMYLLLSLGIAAFLYIWYGMFIDFTHYLEKYREHKIVKSHALITWLSAFSASAIFLLVISIWLAPELS